MVDTCIFNENGIKCNKAQTDDSEYCEEHLDVMLEREENKDETSKERNDETSKERNDETSKERNDETSKERNDEDLCSFVFHGGSLDGKRCNALHLEDNELCERHLKKFIKDSYKGKPCEFVSKSNEPCKLFTSEDGDIYCKMHKAQVNSSSKKTQKKDEEFKDSCTFKVSSGIPCTKKLAEGSNFCKMHEHQTKLRLKQKSNSSPVRTHKNLATLLDPNASPKRSNASPKKTKKGTQKSSKTCSFITKAGNNCNKDSTGNSEYCSMHEFQMSSKTHEKNPKNSGFPPTVPGVIGKTGSSKRNNHQYSLRTVKGSSKTMNDSHFKGEISINGFNCFIIGVAHGHGGVDTSQYIANNYVGLLETILTSVKGKIDENVIRMSLVRCNIVLDNNLKMIIPDNKGGSSLLVAVITDSQIFMSNCGNSRGIVAKNGYLESSTKSHEITSNDEFTRIKNAGGLVSSLDGLHILMSGEKESVKIPRFSSSRTIGDYKLKEFGYLINTPDISIVDKINAEYIVLTTENISHFDLLAKINKVKDFSHLENALIPKHKTFNETISVATYKI